MYEHDGMVHDEAHPTCLTTKRWEKCEEPWTETPLVAALAAAPAPPMSEVQVKPLEWEMFWKQDEEHREIANPPIGDSYHVSARGWWFGLDVLNKCDGIEAAKAAAQADYEARIRSALFAAPQPAAEAGAQSVREDDVPSISVLIEQIGKAQCHHALPVEVRELLNNCMWTFVYQQSSVLSSPAPQPAASEPARVSVEAVTVKPEKTLEFGHGKFVIDNGTHYGKPAVFVAPAQEPGKVNTSAARENQPLDRFVEGEMVLTFPTEEQALYVLDALFNRPRGSGFQEVEQSDIGEQS
jgi:hypothetical protein